MLHFEAYLCFNLVMYRVSLKENNLFKLYMLGASGTEIKIK